MCKSKLFILLVCLLLGACSHTRKYAYDPDEAFYIAVPEKNFDCEGGWYTTNLTPDDWERRAEESDDFHPLPEFFYYPWEPFCSDKSDFFFQSYRTGGPLPGKKTKTIDDKFLTAFKNWQNPHGRPWTMAALIPNLTPKEKYQYSVRLAIGQIIFSSLPLTLSEIFNYNESYQSWAVKNLSEYAATSGQHFTAELFAWYTSPYYEKGSLPEYLESRLEKLALMDFYYHTPFLRAKVREQDFFPDLLESFERAKDPNTNYDFEVFPMGHDDVTLERIMYWEKKMGESWVLRPWN